RSHPPACAERFAASTGRNDSDPLDRRTASFARSRVPRPVRPRSAEPDHRTSHSIPLVAGALQRLPPCIPSSRPCCPHQPARSLYASIPAPSSASLATKSPERSHLAHEIQAALLATSLRFIYSSLAE